MPIDIDLVNVVKVLAPTTISFVIGIAITPFLTTYLYANKMWKKRAKQVALDGRGTPVFAKLHSKKEVGTPRMGGVVIWASVLATTFLFWVASFIFPDTLAAKFDFLSRNQTWLPLFTLLIGALVGLLDDYLEVSGTFDHTPGGLSVSKRLLAVTIVSCIGALWFFFKLDVSSILVPFVGTWEIGFWFVPFFVLVMLATYSGGVIDGIDGLSGGVFASIFSAYGTIAFFQNQIDLAALCFVIVGAILIFLWFNIPPARFYMSETGTMALTMTLAVVAFLTQHVLVLPIIALPLVVTSASTIIQLVSKKMRNGKQVFITAPLHHHLEAIGWPRYKITMRYWVISIVTAIIGVLVALLG